MSKDCKLASWIFIWNREGHLLSLCHRWPVCTMRTPKYLSTALQGFPFISLFKVPKYTLIRKTSLLTLRGQPLNILSNNRANVNTAMFFNKESFLQNVTVYDLSLIFRNCLCVQKFNLRSNALKGSHGSSKGALNWQNIYFLGSHYS